MTVSDLRQKLSEKELRQWLQFFKWEQGEEKKDIQLELLSNGFKRKVLDGE